MNNFMNVSGRFTAYPTPHLDWTSLTLFCSPCSSLSRCFCLTFLSRVLSTCFCLILMKDVSVRERVHHSRKMPWGDREPPFPGFWGSAPALGRFPSTQPPSPVPLLLPGLFIVLLLPGLLSFLLLPGLHSFLLLLGLLSCLLLYGLLHILLLSGHFSFLLPSY